MIVEDRIKQKSPIKNQSQMSLFLLPILSGNTLIDFLGSTGKIYSVVLVILILFIGIVIYLWRLDKKLTKLEKEIKNEH